MLSRENRIILIAIFVVMPLGLLGLWTVDGWYGLPPWTAGAAAIGLGVLLPQFYIGYVSAND